LNVSGADLGSASAGSLNVTGIVTASGFSGNVTGNINATGVSTIATLNVTQSNLTRLNVSGVSTFSAGSASDPSISPSGDSNTGIFFPAADTIAFAEGGVEALRIDSNANIGIGTNNPSQKLEVVGGEIKAGRVDSTNEGGQVSFGRATDNATGWYIDAYGNTSTPQLRVVDVSNAAVRASIDSSGNLTLNSGNLVFSTSGKGIDFSATANSSGTMTSELLSDYEEGTFSPFSASDVTNRGITIPNEAFYIKIGRTCYIWFRFLFSNTASSAAIGGTLPFAGSTPTTNNSYSPFFLTVFPKQSYPGSANGAVGFCYNAGDATAGFTFFQNNANYVSLNWNSGPTEYAVIGCYRTI
jgi:hypothetical protein